MAYPNTQDSHLSQINLSQTINSRATPSAPLSAPLPAPPPTPKLSPQPMSLPVPALSCRPSPSVEALEEVDYRSTSRYGISSRWGKSTEFQIECQESQRPFLWEVFYSSDPYRPMLVTGYVSSDTSKPLNASIPCGCCHLQCCHQILTSREEKLPSVTVSRTSLLPLVTLVTIHPMEVPIS